MMLTRRNIVCENDFVEMVLMLPITLMILNVVDGVVQEESDGGKSRLLVAQ